MRPARAVAGNLALTEYGTDCQPMVLSPKSLHRESPAEAQPAGSQDSDWELSIEVEPAGPQDSGWELSIEVDGHCFPHDGSTSSFVLQAIPAEAQSAMPQDNGEGLSIEVFNGGERTTHASQIKEFSPAD